MPQQLPPLSPASVRHRSRVFAPRTTTSTRTAAGTRLVAARTTTPTRAAERQLAVSRLRALLVSPAARPLRFAVTGGLAGIVQLLLLSLLVHYGWQALLANAAAFLLAAQLNFALSNLFTWRDRAGGRSLSRRWLAFHASIAAMACVNMAIYAAARVALPDLVAAATGIAGAALGNFLIGDRLVFRAAGPVVARGPRKAAHPSAA